jgi:hypothetical protein
MSSLTRKTTVFNNTQYDYMYLRNSRNENVAIYTGGANATNPGSDGPGVVIRFKAEIATRFLAYLVPGQCVRIKMIQDSQGFIEVITVVELYKAYTEKNPRHLFRQIAPR